MPESVMEENQVVRLQGLLDFAELKEKTNLTRQEINFNKTGRNPFVSYR